MTTFAIYFDVDGVLWDTHGFLQPTLEQCIKKGIEKGLKGDKEELLASLDYIRSVLGSNSQEHFDYLVSCANDCYDTRIIRSMSREYKAFKPGNMRPVQNIHQVLNYCARKGHLMGVASNGIYVKQLDKLMDLNLLDFFEVYAITPRLRVIGDLISVGDGENQKPSSYVWDNLREKIHRYFGEYPQKEIHVGDRYKADIMGANSLGIISVKVNFGKYKDETIEEVIEKDGRDPKALKILLEEDYKIDDMRLFPKVLGEIEKDYANFIGKKNYQKEVAKEFVNGFGSLI